MAKTAVQKRQSRIVPNGITNNNNNKPHNQQQKQQRSYVGTIVDIFGLLQKRATMTSIRCNNNSTSSGNNNGQKASSWKVHKQKRCAN